MRPLATPLLVPMIEEGFIHNNISHDIIANYLSDDQLKAIDSIILGCTHYPLIGDEIKKFYNEGLVILDSSSVTADHTYQFLRDYDLLSSETRLPNKFYVSDFTEGFEKMTKMFFGELIHLERYKLWE